MLIIDYDGKHLTYSMLSQDLSTKRSVLINYETVMNSAETNWQICSDNNAVANANLRDLKMQYASIFTAIENSVTKVDTLEKQLIQAKIDLSNIPKPTASGKRKPKKSAIKYYADGAYIQRGGFVPDPK